VLTCGRSPRWRADGGEIFYVAPDNKLMSATITTREAAVQIGTARPLFVIPPMGNLVANYTPLRYDISHDGSRFLVAIPRNPSASTRITLVVNWPALLTGS
jgi:hypothetical protein